PEQPRREVRRRDDADAAAHLGKRQDPLPMIEGRGNRSATWMTGQRAPGRVVEQLSLEIVGRRVARLAAWPSRVGCQSTGPGACWGSRTPRSSTCAGASREDSVRTALVVRAGEA